METLLFRVSGTHSLIVSHALRMAYGGLAAQVQVTSHGTGDQEKEEEK